LADSRVLRANRLAQATRQARGIERLGEVVARAVAQSTDRRIYVGVGRHQDADDILVLSSQAREQLYAVVSTEAYVDQGCVGREGGQRRQSRARGVHRAHLETFRLEQLDEALGEVLVVLDEEYAISTGCKVDGGQRRLLARKIGPSVNGGVPNPAPVSWSLGNTTRGARQGLCTHATTVVLKHYGNITCSGLEW
jgi:hypothetical protein